MKTNQAVHYYKIPVFVPELACPFRCVYCNQYDISGVSDVPEAGEVEGLINKHLSTMPDNNCHVEVAFFGGNFTGINIIKQQEYLSVARKFVKAGKIDGIRVSTRPDYINDEILKNLKIYDVTAIEIGAQSMDDGVLLAAGRGHTSLDVKNAAGMIIKNNFELGIQMMTGLPGDTVEKAIDTAKRIVELKADTTRIYPALVLKNSSLAAMYRDNIYTPQTLEEAVALCAEIFILFEKVGVKVLRMGLHPSESFYDGESLLAGPFHPAFGELVMSKVWNKRIAANIKQNIGEELKIYVNPTQLNQAIGHKSSNKKHFSKSFDKVKYFADRSLKKDQFHVDYR